MITTVEPGKWYYVHWGHGEIEVCRALVVGVGTDNGYTIARHLGKLRTVETSSFLHEAPEPPPPTWWQWLFGIEPK